MTTPLFILGFVGIRLGIVGGSLGQDPSTVGHVKSLSSSLALLLTHPLGMGIGTVGPRAFQFTNSPVLVESSPLLFGLEAGAICLIAYLVMLTATTARLAIRLSDPALQPIHGEAFALIGLAVLVATSVSQLVLPVLQDASFSWQLWLILGCSLAGSGARRC